MKSRAMKLAWAAALGMTAAGAVGCAHCGTCDEFPTPCLGADCGGASMVTAAPLAMGPPILEAAPITSAPSAPATGPGPFTAPNTTGGGAKPTSESPPAPPAGVPNP